MTTPTSSNSELIDAARSILAKLPIQETAHAARQSLADRLRFELPPDEWDAFQLALHRPANAKPKLLKLLNEPSLLG